MSPLTSREHRPHSKKQKIYSIDLEEVRRKFENKYFLLALLILQNASHIIEDHSGGVKTKINIVIILKIIISCALDLL
jgi:hypothetical protein